MMWQQALGFVGVVQILLAYYLVQAGIIHSQQTRYSVLNLSGASLVLLSLSGSDNVAAMTLEGAWIAISLYGIWRSLNDQPNRSKSNRH